MKKLICIGFFGLLAGMLASRELNCSVQILSPTIQGTTEKKILETLKQDIFQFMNNKKWTNDVYKTEERIECSIIINISDKPSADEYKGSIQVQLNRPVFNTAYKSLLFNYQDNDLDFHYIEFEPLEFIENTHKPLTSLLAYYAYVLIGMDYDTFSLEGGTPFYQKAQAIVATAQNAPEKGWKAFEGSKNRYWLIENLLSPVFKPLRECNYKYHRLGFDAMAKDVPGSRTVVLDALLLLQKVYQEKPGSFNLQMFFVAKADEIVNLFAQAQPDEKTKVLQLLNEVDPANSNKYQKISGN